VLPFNLSSKLRRIMLFGSVFKAAKAVANLFSASITILIIMLNKPLPKTPKIKSKSLDEHLFPPTLKDFFAHYPDE
jgi:hypothetical protein